MPRTARIVAPGVPHHVTQRGNRRQRVYFREADYARYKALMAAWCAREGVAIWAWCLMPNHVHLIAVPEAAPALARAIGEAHRRYTLDVNRRRRWTGHLWQGRFASFAMDEAHTLMAARYIELNPVAAGLVKRPEQYPWSSARGHLAGRDDGLASAAPLLALAGDWRAWLKAGGTDDFAARLAGHAASGWPLGGERFLDRLERALGRPVRPRRRGRPRKAVTA